MSDQQATQQATPFKAHQITVIRTNFLQRGAGVPQDPFRRVEQFWHPEGHLLAENDPAKHEIYSRDLSRKEEDLCELRIRNERQIETIQKLEAQVEELEQKLNGTRALGEGDPKDGPQPIPDLHPMTPDQEDLPELDELAPGDGI